LKENSFKYINIVDGEKHINIETGFKCTTSDVEFAWEKGEVLSGFGELSRYSSFLKFPDLNTPSAVSINFFT